MIIKHNLLPKQKTHKYNLNVDIDLYPYATELYEELNRIGIIERVKEIPQLGVIKVSKKLAKTRYDYMMLQLYIHKLIKCKLQDSLRYTYNNILVSKEFRDNYIYPIKETKPSLGDILQLLTIVYNIGHFYNTFTASRAATIVASEYSDFRDLIVNSSNDIRYQNAANKICDDRNYHRFHLLNSILILEKCDTSKQSVSVALEILYAYINEESLPEESKLKYAFSIFRSVRTVSYAAYDLQISETPITIDLCNEKAVLLLLEQLLSEYNDRKSTSELIRSISKLLDDTVYNENSNAICYYKISRRMAFLTEKETDFSIKNFYDEFFISKESIFNVAYPHKRDFIQTNILKLTFSKEERRIAGELLFALEKINNTRVGYYDRHMGEQTVLVSIKNTCSYESKRYAAYKTMKQAINLLRTLPNVKADDIRFLLCVKFFLFYFFDENPIVIKPTINPNKCVICTRGKNSRIREVKLLLRESIGNEDENHEVEFLLTQLKNDTINDTTITIPASVLVYQKGASGRKLCEFDGMIIHPMRKEKQIVFLEAKNTSNRPNYGKNCLKEKLACFPLNVNFDEILVLRHDAFLQYSISG